MTDYSNSVIYMIYCKDNNITPRYIGSSSNLKNRKLDHKKMCNSSSNKYYNLYVYRFIRENGGWDNWEFRVLEEYPCDTKDQLREREDFYMIQFNNLLNSIRAKRNKKEWRNDNYKKIKAQKSQIFMCVCGVNYTHSHKKRHERTKKHQDYIKNNNQNK